MSPELTHRGPPSLLHAPALAWPAIAGCLGLAAIAFAGAPLLGLRGPRGYPWLLFFAGASLWRLGAARSWNRAELGLLWRAEPSAGFWVRAALGMGSVVLLSFAVASLFSRRGIDPLGLCGQQVPWSASRAWVGLAYAPLVEETIFRLLLCGALAGAFSPAANIAVSGAAFAGVHIAFGGIGPDSLVGGFLLAWAFLRSGTIAVPIALHALGNAALLLMLASHPFHALACAAP
jgi:membrane protease YdiL (CAAX protease family)